MNSNNFFDWLGKTLIVSASYIVGACIGGPVLGAVCAIVATVAVGGGCNLGTLAFS